MHMTYFLLVSLSLLASPVVQIVACLVSLNFKLCTT